MEAPSGFEPRNRSFAERKSQFTAQCVGVRQRAIIPLFTKEFPLSRVPQNAVWVGPGTGLRAGPESGAPGSPWGVGDRVAVLSGPHTGTVPCLCGCLPRHYLFMGGSSPLAKCGQLEGEIPTRFTLSELVNEKRGISPEMAVRLSKVFGGSAESWLVQQAQYDLAHVHADCLKLKRLELA